jgi:hypothetical protein
MRKRDPGIHFDQGVVLRDRLLRVQILHQKGLPVFQTVLEGLFESARRTEERVTAQPKPRIVFPHAKTGFVFLGHLHHFIEGGRVGRLE